MYIVVVVVVVLVLVLVVGGVGGGEGEHLNIVNAIKADKTNSCYSGYYWRLVARVFVHSLRHGKCSKVT